MLTKLQPYYQCNWKQLILWFIGWTFLGIILAQTEIADAYRGGFSGYPWEPWSWAFSAVYAFAVLTPIIVYFCDQWPFEKKQLIKTFAKLILLYLPIALSFITLMLGLRFLIYWLVLGKAYPVDDFVARYIYEFPKTISFYFAVVFIAYTRFYQRRVQQEQLNAAKLEVELLDVMR